MMAVDVGIGYKQSCAIVPGEPALGLRNDGYYWHLYPFFKNLQDRTGKLIDLYGDALFFGGELDYLSQLLAEATSQVSAKPKNWEVCTANASDTNEAMYQTVEKQKMLNLLDNFATIVARAQVLNNSVVCCGD